MSNPLEQPVPDLPWLLFKLIKAHADLVLNAVLNKVNKVNKASSEYVCRQISVRFRFIISCPMKSRYLTHLKKNKQIALNLLIYKAPQSGCLANSRDTLRRMIFFILVSAQPSVIFTCQCTREFHSSLFFIFLPSGALSFFFFKDVYACVLVSLFHSTTSIQFASYTYLYKYKIHF